MGTPGLAETLSAPGMWLTAYSARGRASSTLALRLAMTSCSSRVEISRVLAPDSPSVAAKTSAGAQSRKMANVAIMIPPSNRELAEATRQYGDLLVRQCGAVTAAAVPRAFAARHPPGNQGLAEPRLRKSAA